jgi:hypothetical protein
VDGNDVCSLADLFLVLVFLRDQLGTTAGEAEGEATAEKLSKSLGFQAPAIGKPSESAERRSDDAKPLWPEWAASNSRSALYEAAWTKTRLASNSAGGADFMNDDFPASADNRDEWEWTLDSIALERRRREV